ncbi:TPA: hypothetical protein EYP66_10860 [Candidatus Poribacteria bacterium]|nr:hypothetical protein [Candidatus Poribacteria bacterium]
MEDWKDGREVCRQIMKGTPTNRYFLTIITLGLLLFSFCLRAEAFIQREYTLKEVLSASTNIVFGRLTSVDKKRMRAIVEVQENLKGTSDFKRIKMNIAVGQTQGKLTSPRMMMERLENGLPILVFYQKEGNNIAALGYVSKTWFQLFAADQPNRDRVWWRHTHIEVYMHRTFNGTTERLYEIVKDALIGKMWPGASPDAVKVLVLTGNGAKPVLSDESTGTASATAEFLALKKFNEVNWNSVAYQETRDRRLPGLEDADILWIGQREIGDNGYHLSKDTEDRIKRFVKKGGVVILSSQDSDPEKPCGDGWSPEPILGVDGQRKSDFQIVNPSAESLFHKPNFIKSGQIVMDDTWTNWSTKYTVLATTNSGKDIALAMLKWRRGLYLITALQNATEQDVKANAPLMENLIYFAVNHLKLRTKEPPVNVLALTGNVSKFEFYALARFDKVGEHEIRYIQTKDRRLPKLDGADILWIGQGEISEEKYLLDKSVERKIRDFVKKGGVTVVVGQDSDHKRPCETGWITRRLVGVERNSRRDFRPTQKAGDLFRRPNTIKSGQLHIDDTWTDWDKRFDILATTNSGKDIVVATLKEGKGMYIVTGIQNETEEDVKANAPLMENLIHFAVNHLSRYRDVVSRLPNRKLMGKGERVSKPSPGRFLAFPSANKFSNREP